MKILAYCSTLTYTGAPLMLFRLLRALVARGHQVDLLHPRHAIEYDHLLRDYEAAGISCRANAAPGDYDVVLVNTLLAADVVLAAARTAPVVWWIHEPRFGAQWLSQGKVDARAFAAARRIIFPTCWQRDTVYAPWLAGCTSAVVPHGIGVGPVEGPSPFPPATAATVTLLQVGTITRRKGQDLTLRALLELADPRLRLFLLGPHEDHFDFYSRLQRFIAEYPSLARHVTLLGPRPAAETLRWIAHCDALVFPTRDDLITVTILEALHYRRCVLASDFGPIPETLAHDDSALLSPVGDWRGLAANMRRLLAEPGLIDRLGRGGRAAYDRRHAFPVHVAAMEAELAAAQRAG